MDIEAKGFKGELEDRQVGEVAGREDLDRPRRALVRGDLDGESGGGVVFQQRGMDEVVFPGLAVPEETRGFLAAGAFYSLGLQSGGGFAVESVFDGGGGGFIDGRQLGELGRDGGDQGARGAGRLQGKGADLDGGRVVEGVASGDGEMIVRCGERIQRLGSRGIEADDFFTSF